VLFAVQDNAVIFRVLTGEIWTRELNSHAWSSNTWTKH